jgi:hypothetical protein
MTLFFPILLAERGDRLWWSNTSASTPNEPMNWHTMRAMVTLGQAWWSDHLAIGLRLFTPDTLYKVADISWPLTRARAELAVRERLPGRSISR